MGSRLYTAYSSQLSVIPGVALCLTLGLAALFSSPFWGVPPLVLALFLGYIVGDPARERPFNKGIEFSRRSVLQLGVILLGLRLDPAQILSLGWFPLLLVAVAVPLTLLFSWLIGRWLRLPTEYWLIGGAAIAICGASAAMAVAAVLNLRNSSGRALAYIVASVTGIGSMAMIGYPYFIDLLGLDAQRAGLLIGVSIHDVAQVAGAGYAISNPAGDVAIYTKMLRVAALVPVIAVIALWQRGQEEPGKGFPGFLYAFAALVTLNALGLVGTEIKQVAETISQLCLVTAMIGLGAKIQFAGLLGEGWRPLILLVALSLLLFVLPLLALTLTTGF